MLASAGQRTQARVDSDVTEFRVVAEHDEYPIEEYEASARFKDAAAASYREGGVKNLYRGDPPPTRR